MGRFRFPLLAAVAVLAGCAGTEPQTSEIIDTEGFFGLVAADEPRAVLVARDLLAAGGTAADAAAGLAFALSVTYPSAAALGGGGICVVYDQATNKGEVLDFLPKAPAVPGPVAVPGTVRGMAALQSRFGKLRWEQVLAPAEQLSRLGHPLSRAAVRAANAAGPAVLESVSIGRLAADGFGRPLAEGEMLQQPDLGTTISRLRVGGANEFYSGELSRQFLRAAVEAGATFTEEELRASVAEWREPLRFTYDNITLMVPPPPAGGDIVRQLWQATVAEAGLIGSARVSREDLGQALGQAYSGIPGNAPVGGTASSGFAVADKNGNAVACTLTMRRPFGAQRMAAGTGILLAAAGGEADETRFLAPLVGANFRVKQVFVAAAASGGAPAPAALVEVMSAAMAEDQPLEKAMASPRLFRAGPSAVVLHEPGLPAAAKASLQQQGFPLTEVSRLGRVNLLYCSNALPREPESCRVRTDRRGYGLSVGEF